jgi:Flp pilus assembly protein TadD
VSATRRAAAAGLVLALLPCAFAAPSEDGADQALAEDADYAAGLQALKASDFGRALTSFQSALRRFPEAADLHNELGYAHRRLRQFDKAFEHYKRALTIDPRHRSAHEYIGEAYLLVGDVASAERHLAALRSICLLPCDEMEDLRKAIVAHRAQATVAR